MSVINHGGRGQQIDPDLLDFSANINPIGVPLELKRKISANLNQLIYYPDPDYCGLRKQIAAAYKLDFKNIWVGNGSVSLIYEAVRVLNVRTALVFAPTFGEYEAAMRKMEIDIRTFQLNKQQSFQYNADEIISYLKQNSDIDFVCLCNPNNPTGSMINTNAIRMIVNYCNANHIWLMLDEAFNDFLLEDRQTFSFEQDIRPQDKVIIIKSLTKFYAIPGIRLGIAVCPSADLVTRLKERMEPWSVNTFAALIDENIINDSDYKQATAEWLKTEKGYLERELSKIRDINFYSSQVNFYLLKSPRMDLAKKLMRRKVLVRDCSNFRMLDSSYIRIAVRSHRENEVLIKSLKQILESSL
ncbi:pyridoxal phosphate-dependent aminotransferase [Pediococcus claussenii]|uniref:Aminotransferase n=1 Tax=Pediococcus claussenii (strain ATCC BAA-344 / DSM 14800 / JCM 18046 / KCTC 3811 / LMG 21948 / P06) TaxID=701521 RepID=G8PEL9_PEDCP|nr:threonine-phosphate decarboxylase [Pediococcus claussenii]AEV95628.1 threonine-phosphate decarboxylase [Pediococcus claussenii ATCC BAA-344]ANZ69148.1 threonine-phosphate decarboxylase [Pediococcus claussenii]ANZ70965.1 threonine-phosphate decarboxylase [Pediococcus claussenii]KRN20139.1 cobD protein [Pediococcus claussenii]